MTRYKNSKTIGAQQEVAQTECISANVREQPHAQYQHRLHTDFQHFQFWKQKLNKLGHQNVKAYYWLQYRCCIQILKKYNSKIQFLPF